MAIVTSTHVDFRPFILEAKSIQFCNA